MDSISKAAARVCLSKTGYSIARTLAHLHRLFRVIVNPGEFFADGVRITYWDYKSRHAVFYQVRPRAICCSDDGQARRHRFDDVAPESFNNRRKDMRVAAPHSSAKLLARDVSQPPHAHAVFVQSHRVRPVWITGKH